VAIVVGSACADVCSGLVKISHCQLIIVKKVAVMVIVIAIAMFMVLSSAGRG